MEQQIDSGMNLYDMNKQLMEQTGKPMSVYAINEALRSTVKNFIVDNTHKYFMLLCHEKRDYTLFNLGLRDSDNYLEETMQALKECMQNRGILYSIDMDEHNTAVELWIKTDNGFNCYLFFPYDEGVIEI